MFRKLVLAVDNTENCIALRLGEDFGPVSEDTAMGILPEQLRIAVKSILSIISLLISTSVSRSPAPPPKQLKGTHHFLAIEPKEIIISANPPSIQHIIWFPGMKHKRWLRK